MYFSKPRLCLCVIPHLIIYLSSSFLDGCAPCGKSRFYCYGSFDCFKRLLTEVCTKFSARQIVLIFSPYEKHSQLRIIYSTETVIFAYASTQSDHICDMQDWSCCALRLSRMPLFNRSKAIQCFDHIFLSISRLSCVPCCVCVFAGNSQSWLCNFMYDDKMIRKQIGKNEMNRKWCNICFSSVPYTQQMNAEKRPSPIKILTFVLCAFCLLCARVCVCVILLGATSLNCKLMVSDTLFDVVACVSVN